MIDGTTAENQYISRKLVQNEEEKPIDEMKIQKVSKHGNKEKKPMMTMMKWKTRVSCL